MSEKDKKINKEESENISSSSEDSAKKPKIKSAAWIWILVAVAFLAILLLWLIPGKDKGDDETPSLSVVDTLTNDGANLIVPLDSAIGDSIATSDTLAAQPMAQDNATPAAPQTPDATPATPAQTSVPTNNAVAQQTPATQQAPAAQPAAQAPSPASQAAPQPAAQAPQAAAPAAKSGQLRVEPIRYGDFSQWVTRNITESKAIGGKTKTLYEVGPTATISGNNPYSNTGGSPWATSNVYAKVAGIVKGSGTVSPANVNGNTMAKLEAKMEEVKVLGIVNMDVMVAGTIFLGQIYEPISSTKSPFSKMEMGVPYTKRPRALVLDYKVDMPAGDTRTKATGFGSKQTLQGRDNAEVYVLLQKRWEDEKGNIHALRVGTGRERYNKTIPLTKGHQIPIEYGDVSRKPGAMGLLTGDRTTYAKNSKGKLVKVQEEGWAPADAVPTHVMVMCSSSCGTPFVGTEGLTLYVDNIGFGF